MKRFTMPKGLLGLLIVSVLWTACSKEKSTVVPESETEFSQEKVSGVVDDNPALQAKVPLIVSSGFLSKAPEAGVEVLNLSMVAARGKRDAIAPTISIISPTSGSFVTGTSTVQVSASDNVGVSSVSLDVDGVAVSSSSVAPFTNTWNSATASNGTHTLTVTARDAANNRTSSSVTVSVNNVTVGDVTAPIVNISSPVNGASYNTGTTINISASASDNTGVTSLSISINGVVVGSSSSSSYTYPWNTTNAASGIHTIVATARDAAGNQSVRSITITLNTTVVEPPSTSGFRLTMPPVGNQGSEGSCVAFSVGYAARSAEQYYRSGATSYSNAATIFSPEFLYNQIKFNSDCNSGSAMQTALDFIKLNGICTFQTMPYSSSNGCSTLPTSSQSSEAQNYKISSYAKLFTTDRAAIKSMVTQKHPVIISILADNSFISAKAGFIWKTYSGSGSLPHSVVICGYDDAKNAYLIMNSWGTAWGDAGYSWIDYDFFLTKTGTYCYAIN
ncbi:Ig-like domain-containing protein [Lacibacter sp. H375]|uniref:Ig-like domain-containing protein n=1 Tax=Lacibacter sp. H375 TaxID=3133424 RepID=UPI0030BAEA05